VQYWSITTYFTREIEMYRFKTKIENKLQQIKVNLSDMRN